jgi:ribonucleoside-diphosphate reductase alpha chain
VTRASTRPAAPRVFSRGELEPPPNRCRTRTFTASISQHRVHLSVAEYKDGRPCRIRIDIHREGGGYRGVMEAFARTASHGLQHGVALSVYVDDWIGCTFEPNGATDDAEIPSATSILDWIARRLLLEYPEHAGAVVHPVAAE